MFHLGQSQLMSNLAQMHALVDQNPAATALGRLGYQKCYTAVSLPTPWTITRLS